MKKLIPVVRWVEEEMEDDIYSSESLDDLEESDSFQSFEIAFMKGYLAS